MNHSREYFKALEQKGQFLPTAYRFLFPNCPHHLLVRLRHLYARAPRASATLQTFGFGLQNESTVMRTYQDVGGASLLWRVASGGVRVRVLELMRVLVFDTTAQSACPQEYACDGRNIHTSQSITFASKFDPYQPHNQYAFIT